MYRGSYVTVLGFVSDVDGEVYYHVTDLIRFLQCPKQEFTETRDRLELTTYRYSIAPDRVMVEHSKLLNVLENMMSEKSTFLFNFLEYGHVRSVFGPWFTEHRIKQCDESEGQSYPAWLQGFKAEPL